MIALDTNILIYSKNRLAKFHEPARALLFRFAEGVQPWAIAWPSIYEFLRVITHPRVLTPPFPADIALNDLRGLFASQSLRLLSETTRHAEIMDHLLRESRVIGNDVFDARIAALCIEHGVDEILTADRDFRRFPLKATNPFL